jgi:transcriptional regulator with XRE-family HTH domain
MTVPVCYVRPLRRQWGLSQEELSRLLGFRSPTHISRIEQGKRVPTLETVLALEVLFGTPPKTMFPALAEESAERVLREAAALFEVFRNDPSLRAARKRELLIQALEHGVKSPHSNIGL